MDNFIPAKIEQPAPQPPEVQAQIQLAGVTADPQFSTLLKASAMWLQVLTTVPRINNDQDYQNALELFTKVKRAIDAKENFRHSVVDVPTKFVRLVNDMLRPLGDNFEKVKGHLSRIISDWDAIKRREAEEAQRKADEAHAAQQEQPAAPESADAEIPGPPAEGKVQIDPPEVAAPPTTVKTESGQVQMREFVEIEITDKIALLKAIVSKAERNEIYTTELVSFNEPGLKKLCEGRRKIPGVKWERKKKAV